MKTTPAAFLAKPCTAFSGFCAVASGPLVDVALAIQALGGQPAGPPVLVFDDSTGEVIDLDLRGSTADIIYRLTERARQRTVARRSAERPDPGTTLQGPGRPRLGVIAREVTLLPRHWEWLAAQSGGTSAALRRLVEQARLSDGGKTEEKQAKEATYRFLSCLAGNLAGFEEATRSLFADDWNQFAKRTSEWPKSVRDYAHRLAKHSTHD